MPEVRAFSHVAFTVTDVEVSAVWYEALLGAQRATTGSDDGHSYAVLVAPNGVIVGLHNHSSTHHEDEFSEARVGLDHVAFAVADRAELEEWREHLEGLGIAHSGILESSSGRHLNFRDPDNIQLEFFASVL
jgi:glyoxylase I family protein